MTRELVLWLGFTLGMLLAGALAPPWGYKLRIMGLWLLIMLGPLYLVLCQPSPLAEAWPFAPTCTPAPECWRWLT